MGVITVRLLKRTNSGLIKHPPKYDGCEKKVYENFVAKPDTDIVHVVTLIANAARPMVHWLCAFGVAHLCSRLSMCLMM